MISNILDKEGIEEFRLFNVPDTAKKNMRNIRAKDINSLIVTKGIIRRASSVKPKIYAAKFECRSCGNRVVKEQSSNQIQSPYKCSCGSRKFKVIKKMFKDVQNISLEEAPENLEGSQQPERIHIVVSGSLVEPNFQKNINPGNKIKIVGVLRSTPAGKKSDKYIYYVEANNIIPDKVQFSQIDISEEDEKEIEGLSENNNMMQLFTESIATSIYGMVEIKQALALQLFGGVRKIKSDDSVVRGDIHVLLIGEPGTGKTKLTKYVSKLSPKGRYASGGSLTETGVTAAVVKDKDGDWALDAGPMVLSDGGTLCMDELDLVDKKELKKMNEALENQELSVTKANINATLQTRTSLLASGNPKYDRFDPYEPVADQIEVLPSVLSRFDLVFPIQDVPDEDKDENVAGRILEGAEEKEKQLDTEFMRKYIAHAKNIKPSLTQEAKKKMKDFYIKLRNKSDDYHEEGKAPVAITARELESLIRLSEASARLRLSEEVNVDDVERVIDIMKFYLEKVGMDPESGMYDIDMTYSKTPSSKREKIKTVLRIIEGLENDLDQDSVPIEDVVAECEDKGLSEVDEIIKKLKREGDIMEPRQGRIKKL